MPLGTQTLSKVGFWNQFKSLVGKGVPREELATAAKPIQRAPLPLFEKIRKVESLTSQYVEGARLPSTTRGVTETPLNVVKGIPRGAAGPSTLFFKENLPKFDTWKSPWDQTAPHELGHVVYNHFLKEPEKQSLDAWYKLHAGLGEVERLEKNLGTIMKDSNELFSEGWGRYLRKDSKAFSILPPEAQNAVRNVWKRLTSKPALLAAIGLASLGELSIDDAEAAPIKSLEGLKEGVYPVVKDLLKPRGPVQFDVGRRWWAEKVGRGQIFWNHEKDNPRFLQWVEPYLNDLKEIDPKRYHIAKKLIEVGTKEGHAKWYEIALQNMHGPITHDSPASKAVDDMVIKYGAKPVVDTLLAEVSSSQEKEALKSTLKYWGYAKLLAGMGIGLGALAGGTEEAEAGLVPKKLTQKATEKLGNLSRASSKLQGMELMGKTVKDVRLGHEPWRYITFEDGTYLPIHKKYIHSLITSEGEKEYTSTFGFLKKADQKGMIERSRALREGYLKDPEEIAAGLEERNKHLKELGEEAPARIPFKLKGRETQVPEEYGRWMGKHQPQGWLPPQVSKVAKGKGPAAKAIQALESNAAKRQLSEAETYVLKRLKGTPIEEASIGVRANLTKLEALVGKILKEAK